MCDFLTDIGRAAVACKERDGVPLATTLDVPALSPRTPHSNPSLSQTLPCFSANPPTSHIARHTMMLSRAAAKTATRVAGASSGGRRSGEERPPSIKRRAWRPTRPAQSPSGDGQRVGVSQSVRMAFSGSVSGHCRARANRIKPSLCLSLLLSSFSQTRSLTPTNQPNRQASSRARRCARRR